MWGNVFVVSIFLALALSQGSAGMIGFLCGMVAMGGLSNIANNPYYYMEINEQGYYNVIRILQGKRYIAATRRTKIEAEQVIASLKSLTNQK